MKRAALACLLPLWAHAAPPRLELVATHGSYRHGHDAEATVVLFAPGPRNTWISAGLDRTVRLWRDDDLLAVLPGARTRVHALAARADRLAAAAGTSITLMDLRSRATGLTLLGHTKPITAVAFSPDGARLVSAARDATLRVWDTATGQPLGSVVTGALPLTVRFVDRERTTALLADGSVLTWPVGTSAVQRGVVTALPLDVAASTLDGRILIGAHGAELWSGDARGLTTRIGRATAPIVALAASTSRVVTGDRGGFVTVWDPTATTPLARWQAHAAEITSVALSDDGTTVGTASRDFRVRLWDLATQKPLLEEDSALRAVLPLPEQVIAAADVVRIWPSGTPSGRPGRARALALGPGERLMVGRDDGKLVVGDHELALHRGGINAVGFDGERMVTAGEDGHLRLLQGPPLEVTRDVALAGPLRALVLLPGRAVVAGDRGTLTDVDLSSGKATTRPGPRHGPLLALATDGTRVASAGDDGVIRIDGQTAGRHEDTVWALAFCPDGRCLASGSRDGTIRLFSDGREQTRVDLGPRRDAPRSLAFDARGRLVCGTQRGQVLIFALR